MSVEEVKYSGMGGGHRRKMVDDHEDQLANSSTRLERSRLKYERLSRLITAMKAGVGHLQDKLEAVRDEVGGKRYELGDETVAEVLRECEVCLNNVIRRIRAGDDDRKRAELTGAFSKSSPGAMGDSMGSPGAFGKGEEGNIIARPFNQRIQLSIAEEEDYAHDDAGVPDMDDEELTRDKVKRASTQILQAVDRRMRRAGAKKTKVGGAAESKAGASSSKHDQ